MPGIDPGLTAPEMFVPSDASGAATLGSDGVMCVKAGERCPVAGGCCADSACVEVSLGVSFCAAQCTTNAGCKSDCCAPIRAGGGRTCSAPEVCIPRSAQTVDAPYLDRSTLCAAKIGGVCSSNAECCPGIACVQGVCGSSCDRNDECGSGCCYDLGNRRVCAPYNLCPVVRDAGACPQAGGACFQQGSCCGKESCIQNVCASNCTANGDCVSGCCYKLGNLQQCAPSSLCPSGKDASTKDAPAVTFPGQATDVDAGVMDANALDAPMCIAPGAPCAPGATCCGKGAFCFRSMDGDAVCVADCKTGADCANGCCAAVSGATLCAPKALCGGSNGTGGSGGGAATGENGLVLATHRDTFFAVSTSWGNRSFEARTSCFDVLKGDPLKFTASTGACASNTFVNSRTGNSCDVWCSTTYDGTVVAIMGTAFTISTRLGDRVFEPRISCRNVQMGDRVVFEKSPTVCVSNTILDLRSGDGCDVYCK